MGKFKIDNKAALEDLKDKVDFKKTVHYSKNYDGINKQWSINCIVRIEAINKADMLFQRRKPVLIKILSENIDSPDDQMVESFKVRCQNFEQWLEFKERNLDVIFDENIKLHELEKFALVKQDDLVQFYIKEVKGKLFGEFQETTKKAKKAA